MVSVGGGRGRDWDRGCYWVKLCLARWLNITQMVVSGVGHVLSRRVV
jgi:hypothetical protein